MSTNFIVTKNDLHKAILDFCIKHRGAGDGYLYAVLNKELNENPELQKILRAITENSELQETIIINNATFDHLHKDRDDLIVKNHELKLKIEKEKMSWLCGMEGNYSKSQVLTIFDRLLSP